MQPEEMSPEELLEYIQELRKRRLKEIGNSCGFPSHMMKQELKRVVPLFVKWATKAPASTVHQKIINSPKYAKHRKMTSKQLMKHLQKLDKQRQALKQEEAVTFQLLASWARRLERHL